MSETPISSLDLISKAQIDPANDIIGLVDKSDTAMSVNGSNKKATIESLIGSVLDNFSWGDIGGDIGDQTDLSLALAALDAAKLNKTGGTLTGGLSGTTGAFSGALSTNGVLTVGTVGSTFSRITFAQGVTHTYDIAQPYPEGLLFRRNGQGFAMLQQSTSEFGSYTGGLMLTGGGISWATSSTITNSQDSPNLCLMRDAADTLALRRSTNAQTLRLYGTYTDASNYRRLYVSSTTGGAFTIGVQGLGTGANTNVLRLNTINTTYASTDRLIEFQNNSTTYQAIRPTGSLTKPLHVFVGTDYNWVGTGAGYGNTGAEWEKWLFTVSNDQNHCFGVKYDSVSLGMNTAIRWHNNVHITQNPDLALVRSASGQLDVRGNSGLRVRNFGNTAWANVQTGELLVNNLSGEAPKVKFVNNGSESGIFYNNAQQLAYRFYAAGPCQFLIEGENGTAATNHGIVFSGATELWTEGANVLAIRQSTNAQNLRLYSTYTDSSNYRRLYINSTTGGTFTIGVTGAGTGASGNTLNIANELITQAIRLNTGTNVDGLSIITSAYLNNDYVDLVFQSSYESGWNLGRIRSIPKTGYSGALAFHYKPVSHHSSPTVEGMRLTETGLLQTGPITASGLIHSTYRVTAAGQIFTGTGGLYFASGSRSGMDSLADGNIVVFNNAANNFNLLQFGGTTASFPAIKRNVTAINFRLADDSADAAITAGAVTASGAIVSTAATSTFGTGTASNGAWQIDLNHLKHMSWGITNCMLIGRPDQSALIFLNSTVAGGPFVGRGQDDGGNRVGFNFNTTSIEASALSGYSEVANTFINKGNIETRRGTNATNLYVYGTYTDASNYRRLYISSTTGGAFTLGVQGLGTGASGNTLVINNSVTGYGNIVAAASSDSSAKTITLDTTNNWVAIKEYALTYAVLRGPGGTGTGLRFPYYANQYPSIMFGDDQTKSELRFLNQNTFQFLCQSNWNASNTTINIQASNYEYATNGRKIQFVSSTSGAHRIYANGVGTGATGNSLTFTVNSTDILSLGATGAATFLSGVEVAVNNRITLTEIATPATPAANNVTIYAKDNGSGKTQLVVLMPDGVETVLATQT